LTALKIDIAEIDLDGGLGYRDTMNCDRSFWLSAFARSFLAAAVLAGCAQRPRTVPPVSKGVFTEQARVDAALERYSSMVLNMNSRGIAALFTPDGEIVNPGQAPVRGRAAIEAFLSGFANYRVLENSTIPSQTTVSGSSALQVGSYHQRVRTPQGQVIEVSGGFKAEWVRGQSGDWLIQRMGTTPSP
jgi:uncharacterized protein (TIGR02246 family)